MQSTVIYSTLTKAELIFGISKDAIPIFTIFFAVFMLGKFFIDYSMLFVVPFSTILYFVFFIIGKVNPFYFAVMQKKSKLRTNNFSKHKGNYYAS